MGWKSSPSDALFCLIDHGYQGVLAVESDHHKDHQDEDQLVAESIVYLKALVAEIEKERKC